MMDQEKIGKFISAFVFAFIGVWIEQIAGCYKCTKCGHAYKPTYMNTLMAPHIGRSRKMKCPCCGDKNYHKKYYPHNWGRGFICI